MANKNSKLDTFIETVKTNKKSAFLSLGGMTIAAFVERDLLEANLVGTQALLLAGSLGLGYLWNKYRVNKIIKTNNLKFVTNKNKVVSSFLAIGAAVGAVYLTQVDATMAGVGTLMLGALAANRVFSIANNPDKIKEQITKIRQKNYEKKIKQQAKIKEKQTVEEKPEFAPLRF